MVLEQDTASHAGKAALAGDPNVNSMSIGIEIVNWGELKRKGDGFFCWPSKNPKAPLGDPDREEYTRPYSIGDFGPPVAAKGSWWVPYTNLQTIAVTRLCSEIVKRYPLITPERIVGHEDVAPGRKNDPGPLLNIEDIRRTSFRMKGSSVVARPNPVDEIGEDELYAAQEDRAGE
jgi:N-acetyl-anhydromuramyl-L-alanine amidase AmpD